MKPAVYLYGVPGQYENYLAALESGGVRVILCRDLYRSLDCGGLLPGGGDIRGPLPGTESFLIDSFARSRRPILGICRGLQALNVHWGGTLRDIPGHQLPRGRSGAPHPGGGADGPSAGGSSRRHQLPPPGGGPPGPPPLQAVQWSPDGVVEAAVHRQLPVLGVQWHPERQSYGLRRADAPGAEALFAYFAALIGKTAKPPPRRGAAPHAAAGAVLPARGGVQHLQPGGRRWLALCPQLRQDRDLDAENRGVTYVLLKK